ncbi:hypothetical protein GGR55DRAFT_183354 [Xylaria sp. FL0064]|nr:hypothetical protein GGR55DRAFT_183354 [Xylaria sp. FL0064]
MMGFRPSFFLFLFVEALVIVAEAGLVPLPLAPAIRGTEVEFAVGGMAVAVTASMSTFGADFVAVTVAAAGTGAESEFVVFLVLFIFATSRETKLNENFKGCEVSAKTRPGCSKFAVPSLELARCHYEDYGWGFWEPQDDRFCRCAMAGGVRCFIKDGTRSARSCECVVKVNRAD